MDNPEFNAPPEKSAKFDSAQLNQLYGDLGSLNAKFPESNAKNHLPDLQISGNDARSVGDAAKKANPENIDGKAGEPNDVSNPGFGPGDGRSKSTAAPGGSGDGRSKERTPGNSGDGRGNDRTPGNPIDGKSSGAMNQIRSAYENITDNHMPREFNSISEAVSEATAANSRAFRIARAMQRLV